MDAMASGHRGVALRGNRQSWVIQPDIKEDGNYQIMVRARGTLFGSAYASLGIILGENITDAGSVRLSTSTWQRVPVGCPIRLTKGSQWIGIALANEYRFRNQSLRQADIDSFEIRRITDDTAGGGGMMMGSMMMQGTAAKSGGDKARTANHLRCAFSTIRDGEEINGRLDIRAALHSPSLKKDQDYRDIRSDLWINDAYFATTHGRNPSFQIHPHDLKKGENQIHVRSSSPCGNSAISLRQTLLANAKDHPVANGQAAPGSISNDTENLIDAAPPSLQVIYPKPGSKLSTDGDAVVLQAFDDLKLSHFEIHIDGAKTTLPFPASRDTGPMIFHLPGSVLETGKHKIEVVAFDTSGKPTHSPAIPVEIRESTKSTLNLAYPRAIRLANRLAYGPDPATMIAILTQGEDAWVASETTASWGSNHDKLVEAYARVLFPDFNDYQIRGRVVSDLLATKNPVRSRFALFAQNHFSTWMAKTGTGAKWRENQEFRDAGITRFHDLLLTSATSPAMMVYLDQQNSFALQLNENYAREVMELHTVGVHGGYQQNDVTNLAHLLTGWGAQREATMDGSSVDYNYRFSPYLNEDQSLNIFGLSIPASTSPETADDRITQIIEMLAARPQTAAFIAGKVAAHYIGVPANPEVVDAMSREYLRTGGDLRRLIAVMVKSPHFMAVDLAPKVMTPFEFGVTLQRISTSMHPWSVIGLADRSGRNLFDRASPDGYPENNEEYADSNYQLQKWSFCKELEQSFASTLPQDWFEKEKLKDSVHRDAVIDHAYATRRGTAPNAASREALHAILSQVIADQNQRRILFASFLHMMPEFQSR